MLKHIQLLLSALLCAGLVSCGSTKSHFKDIADLPLKSTKMDSITWQNSPLRANAQYVLYGAQSNKEMKARLGEYFYINWYDASPESPTCIQMLYTQAATASKVLKKEIHFNQPRHSKGSRKTLLSFIGSERAKRGDILSWRLNLIVNGQIVDSRQSYLWKD